MTPDWGYSPREARTYGRHKASNWYGSNKIQSPGTTTVFDTMNRSLIRNVFYRQTWCRVSPLEKCVSSMSRTELQRHLTETALPTPEILGCVSNYRPVLTSGPVTVCFLNGKHATLKASYVIIIRRRERGRGRA